MGGSAIGNITIQLAALGELEISEGKKAVARSFKFKSYQPSLVDQYKLDARRDRYEYFGT